MIRITAANAIKFIRTRAPLWWLRTQYELRWRYGPNASSRRRWRAERGALTQVQRRVVQSLVARGIACVLFQDLTVDCERWNELSADAETFAHSPRVANSIARYRSTFADPQGPAAAYLVKLHKEGPRFTVENPLLRVGLGAPVLDTVNAYLGLWAKLVYADVWHSIPVDVGRRIGSQHWHRDPEDRMMVKAYLYFSDVHAGAGPMEYVPGSCSEGGGPYHHLWPWKPRGSRYPLEEEFNHRVPVADRMACLGPPGTLVFCDTNGLHRGGIATTGVRLVATWTFVTPAGMSTLAPRRFVVEDLEASQSRLSPAARYALT